MRPPCTQRAPAAASSLSSCAGHAVMPLTVPHQPMCLGSWASRVARTSLGCSSSSSGATCSSCAESSGTGRSGAVNQRRRSVRVLAAERDLEWKPTSSRGPLVAPGRGGGGGGGGGIPPPPPPPPRPQQPSWFEAPFASRRNIMLTLAGGAAGLWGLKRATAPIKFADKPDVPFKLTGYTDLAEDDLVYFKTPGGHWVGAAEDAQGRLFMIDEVGDLYYDSGDPDIGMYAVDTQGNLYNFYNDLDGERKITPVGNVSDLQRFKINEIAGVKLDRDVNVVAFKDGREIPLPPGTGFVDANGRFSPPGELVEGYTRSVDSPFDGLFGGGRDAAFTPPERLELELSDPSGLEQQIYGQTLLDDPDIPGFQPALPDDFDLEALAEQVKREAGRGRR